MIKCITILVIFFLLFTGCNQDEALELKNNYTDCAGYVDANEIYNEAMIIEAKEKIRVIIHKSHLGHVQGMPRMS